MPLSLITTLTTLRVLTGIISFGYSAYSNRTQDGQFDFQKIPEAIFGQVIGGLFANWLKEGTDAAYDKFIQKLSEVGTDSLHEELQLAARKAYLSATYLACQSCLEKIKGQRAGLLKSVKNTLWKDEDINWLEAVRNDLQSQIKNSDSDSFSSTVDYKDVFLIFDDSKLVSDNEKSQDIQTVLKNECLKDLKNNYYSKFAGQIAVPFSQAGYDLLKEAILNGWTSLPNFGEIIQLNIYAENQNPDSIRKFDWFTLLCAFFNEDYKTNSRVQAALHRRETNQIRNIALENFSKGLDLLIDLKDEIQELKQLTSEFREESLQLQKQNAETLEGLKSFTEQSFESLLKMLGFSPEKLAFHFSPESVLESFSSPPMNKMVAREELVSRLHDALNSNKILTLYGSSGMGKSTLSYQIVNHDGTVWKIIDMRHLKVEEIKSRLIFLRRVIETINQPIYCLIDDLNFDKDADVYQKALGELTNAARQRDCKIIITSQNKFPENIKNLYELADNSFTNVPELSVEEVKELATIRNCPSGKILDAWADIVWALTKGHPLLVDAQIRYLEKQGWRNPTSEDFLSVSAISDVRTEFRKKLSDQLSADERTLLYRLSIFSGRFQRSNVKFIGRVKPEITLAAEIFDTLVGPYIEPIDSKYFRLSPLLEGNATDIFDKKEIRYLHKAAADSILQQKIISNAEFNSLLQHGVHAEYVRPLVNAALGWSRIPREYRKTVAESCLWFCFANLDKKILPDVPYANQIVRDLQFNIAAEVSPKMAVKIAERWEIELEEFKANTLKMPRFLPASMETRFLQAVVMADQVRFEFTKIVSWFIDLLNMVPVFTESYEEMAKTNPEVIEEYGHLSLTDTLQTPDFFVGYIFVKCKTAHDVIELIDAFDSLTGQKETELWEILKQTNVNFSLLIDKIWLDNIDDSQHDWSINLAQLDHVISMGKKRKMDDFVVEASISKAIIYREYLKDSNLALIQLDNCNDYLAYINPHIENYRATIFHLDNKDEDALTIWKKYLPEIIKQKRYGRPYFVRNAEISASRLNDWEEVNRLALIGEQLSYKTYDGLPETSAVNITALSFRADSALALWKLGRLKEAFKILCEVFEKIPKTPFSDFDTLTKSFYLRLSYMFFWMTDPAKFEAPTAGLFSNPNKVDNLDSLPVHTTDFLWHLLAEVEFQISDEKVVLDRFRREIEKFDRKPFSEKRIHRAVKFVYHQLCIKYSIKALEIDGLITHVRDMYEFADNDQTIPVEVQISGTIKLVFFVLFLEGLYKDASYVFPYEDLKRGISASAADSKSVLDWMDVLKNFSTLNHSELYQRLSNLDEPVEQRLIAAGILSFSSDLSPSEYFYADVSLACHDFTVLREFTEDFIEDIIKKHWLAICENQAFSLQNPRVNIPLIRQACENENSKGLAKVADILLTAQPAVGMTIDQTVRESLSNLKTR